MENKKLLILLQQLISAGASKIIEEGLKSLVFETTDTDLSNFIILILLNIIEKDNIVDNLKFKDEICYLIVDCLEQKKYDLKYFMNKILDVKNNEEFRKLFLISISISYKVESSPFEVFFSILNEKKFPSLKEKINKKINHNINNNTDFFFIVNKYTLEKLYEMANNQDKIDSDFLKFSNNDISKYIGINDNNKKKNYSQIDKTKKKIIKMDKNSENKNDENIIIASNANDEIIKNERRSRIIKLINSSIKIESNNNYLSDDFLNFNYSNIRQTMKIDDIIIDNYDHKEDYKTENKLYLYSPISLIYNNIKNKFDNKDFEIFNSDNYYVEVFGKYLTEIIDKLNDFIINGKEENYIKENKIKFGYNPKHKHFYLCCKFNEQFKNSYYESKIINEKCIIDNDKTKNIEIIKIEGKENAQNDKAKTNSKEENKDIRHNSEASSAQFSKENYINRMSNMLEKDVKEYIWTKNCEDLQNLIFFFNLKLPKTKNNNIIFQSVRLSFYKLSENKYGFREIDICFKNKNNRILESEILRNNFCYFYENGKFKTLKNENIDICLDEESIIFGEVKNSFPNITKGLEKCKEIKMEEPISNDNNYQNITYKDQIHNLIKKAKTFYYFFKDEKVIDKNKMHILYFYDLSDISFFGGEYKTIKDEIDVLMEGINPPVGFKNMIIQIAYFDKAKNDQKKEKKWKDRVEKLEKSEIVKEDEIQKLNVNVQEKEDEIQKLNANVQEKEDEIQKLNANVQAKDNEIQRLNANIKAKDDEIKKLKEMLNNKKQ